MFIYKQLPENLKKKNIIRGSVTELKYDVNKKKHSFCIYIQFMLGWHIISWEVLAANESHLHAGY